MKNSNQKNYVCNKTKHQFKFKLPIIWKQNGAQTKNNLRKFSKQNQDISSSDDDQIFSHTRCWLAHYWRSTPLLSQNKEKFYCFSPKEKKKRSNRSSDSKHFFIWIIIKKNWLLWKWTTFLKTKKEMNQKMNMIWIIEKNWTKL